MENQQEKYINPLTDFGFKKLFGTEPNKNLLIDFLNEVLPDSKIKDLTYVSTEHLGKTVVERNAIFDLSCTGENDERFIVEMQKAKQDFFKDRSVFYASFPIQEQAKKGKWDYKLNPVYSVGILDFIFDDHKDDDTLLHTVSLKNQRCEEFYKKLKFVYIELPKFTKTEAELETHFDKWLYVLRHLPDLEDRPEKLQEKVFIQLFEAAEVAKFTPKERAVYDASLKSYRDLNNSVDSAEGRGEKRGIEKGEKKKQIEIAKEMKDDGFPIESIVKYTKLSREEIENL